MSTRHAGTENVVVICLNVVYFLEYNGNELKHRLNSAVHELRRQDTGPKIPQFRILLQSFFISSESLHHIIKIIPSFRQKLGNCARARFMQSRTNQRELCAHDVYEQQVIAQWIKPFSWTQCQLQTTVIIRDSVNFYNRIFAQAFHGE